VLSGFELKVLTAGSSRFLPIASLEFDSQSELTRAISSIF
jgi:hypothetical protein